MHKKVRRDGDLEDDQEPVLQLDLEGFTPCEKDCEGISRLSQQLFPTGSAVNTMQLAEYIVSHQSVGTVVKPSEYSDDEEEEEEEGAAVVFAFTSIIDLGVQECTRSAVVKELHDWLVQLVRTANPCSAKDDVLSLLDSGTENIRPFFFLNERFESIPLSVCAQAVAGLPEELEVAKMTPTHIFMVSLAYRESSMQYAYPEVEFIRPFALYDLELPNQLVSRDSADIFDTFILNVIRMDSFAAVLDALTSHV